jgi:NADH:ubiquinone oxidoreductase subunit 4 (subunit M)
MLGEPHARSIEFTGLHQTEKIVLIVVALAIIVGGIYPKPILQIAGPALEDLLAQVKDIN